MPIENKIREKLARIVLTGNRGPAEVYAEKAWLVMELIRQEEVIKISVPSEKCSILIGSMTLRWEAPDGRFEHAIAMHEQNKAEILKAIKDAFEGNMAIQTVFDSASCRRAKIEILEERDIE